MGNKMKVIKNMIPKSVKKTIRHNINKVKLQPVYSKMTAERITHSNEARLILFGTPDSKNLGDHAIAEAEMKFMAEFYPDLEYIEFSYLHYTYDFKNIKSYINDNDIILVHGGGFLGNLWIEAELMFRDILKSFPNNKVMVMPQTIFFDERFNKDAELKKSQESYNAHKNLTIFLREQQSYDFVKKNFNQSVNPKLIPDIVTTLEHNSKNTNREDVLMVFRGDKEKLNHSEYSEIIEGIISEKGININHTDTVIPGEVDETNRDVVLSDKFNQFNKHKLIITDRLHGMVFSLITGTPCIAFDNASSKVSGVYEWLKSYDYVHCIDKNKAYTEEDFKEIINQLLSKDDYGYNRENIIDHFEPLKNELDNIKK